MFKDNKLYSQGHKSLEDTLFKDHFGKSHLETSSRKYKWIKIRDNHCLGEFICSSWVPQGRNQEETPQKFQTHFTKIMLKPPEAAQRKGRTSELAWGLALPGCFYKLKKAPCGLFLFRAVWLPFPAVLPGDYVPACHCGGRPWATVRVGQWWKQAVRKGDKTSYCCIFE